MKMLPFMKEKEAVEFYIKIKDITPSNIEEFKIFFEYFENTYLSLDEKSKFKFSLWNTNKIKVKGNENILFKENNFKNNFIFRNNCCESLNHLINEILDVNNNVLMTNFSEVITIANYGIGKTKVINLKDIKKIQNLNNEEEIFKFIFNKNNE